MKERNILAGFRSPEEANQAAEQLKRAGFSIVQIDNVSQYPGDGVETITNPISGEIPSLGNLTLGADFVSGRDASVMAAADPSASGMSDRNNYDITRNILLTAVVPENRGDEAQSIITSCGGSM